MFGLGTGTALDHAADEGDRGGMGWGGLAILGNIKTDGTSDGISNCLNESASRVY